MNSLQNAPYAPTDEAIEILYEDEDLAVIVKPANLLTVPGRGDHKRDCAEQRLKDLGHGFVRAAHRLDQDTSGLLIFGLSKAGHRAASMMFEARQVEKRYEALCWVTARPENAEWTIDLPLMLDWPNRPKHIVDFDAGKPSQTGVRVLESAETDLPDTLRLRLTPITGRSHQLRVHLSHTDLPICGDPLYGRPEDGFDRLCLHAKFLKFRHPLTDARLEFESPAPF